MTKYIAVYRQHPKQSSVHPIRMGQELALDDVGMALASMDSNGWIRPVIIDSAGVVHRLMPWLLHQLAPDSHICLGLFDTEASAWFAMMEHHGSSQESPDSWLATYYQLDLFQLSMSLDKLFDSAMELCNPGPDYPLTTGDLAFYFDPIWDDLD